MTMREAYRRACELFPGHRVELVNGRIVVNDGPTWAHNKIISRLLKLIISIVTDRDWEIGTNIKLFLGPQTDRYVPDLTIAPPRPRMWGDDEVYGDDTRLVVEVVSPSSVHDDHAVKPREYARAGVPLYLLIDPAQSIAILFSLPAEKGYQHRTQVEFGTALDLPEPWKLSIDTGKLVEA
ncbi:Uma2 family endonuclease [Nonomuraea dietziae]|uniref:Uma2 family endonuclease n=1 Tax=Nonomuraea dietziae TaxID=65515 RepID=UPI0033F10BF0